MHPFLKAALFGFPGVRWGETALTLSCPTLMPGAAALKLRGVAWRGARFNFKLANNNLIAELVSSSSSDKAFLVLRPFCRAVFCSVLCFVSVSFYYRPFTFSLCLFNNYFLPHKHS